MTTPHLNSHLASKKAQVLGLTLHLLSAMTPEVVEVMPFQQQQFLVQTLTRIPEEISYEIVSHPQCSLTALRVAA